MRRLTGMLALAGMLLAAAAAAAADRVALVIGNGDYGPADRLASPAQDAGAVAQALDELGFVVTLTVDADRTELDAQLATFAEALAAADVGLVYYSGAAIHTTDRSYLLPVDAVPGPGGEVAEAALPLDAVFALFGRDDLTGLIFIDAAAPVPSLPPAGMTEDGPRPGIGPVVAPPGVLVAVGAVPGTVAPDGDGARSPFTTALLDHIGTPGLEVRLMLDRVGDDVAGATNGAQQPWVRYSGLHEPFVFLPDPDRSEDEWTNGVPINGIIGGIIGGTGAEQPAEPTEQAEAEPPTAGDAPPAPPVEATPEPAVPADPPTADPASVAVTRYPVMDLPERVLPGEPFPLMIWLSRTQVTPEVVTEPGPDASVDESGGLEMTLPDAAEWQFRVVLNAPGFRIGDGAGPIAELVMQADGDSTPALFMLTAEPGAHPDGSATLRATLWLGASYLASFERQVAVGVTAASAGNDRADASGTEPVSLAPGAHSADLTVRVDYADPSALGPGQVIVASPHFRDPLVVGTVDTPAAVAPWIAGNYRDFIAARSQDLARGATRPGGPSGDGALTEPLIRGFGQELYRRYAPEVFKQALWALMDDPDAPLESIQVYSNNPVIPWELMRPTSPDGTRELDYLGAAFRIARWHAGAGPAAFDRPRQELAFDELVAIAPDYGPGEVLSSVAVELESLSRTPGFREVPGRLDALRTLIGTPPRGIVHFAGHGVVEAGDDGLSAFLIRLEDLDLSVMAWRGLGGRNPAGGGPFYFFNACDVGRADTVANFVEGWAPAVIEGGASGFIGGLWPVFDDSAAAFAAGFYADIETRLAEGPASVAAVLQDLRRRFAETGDPTWLGYVYYGDVNLRLIRSR